MLNNFPFIYNTNDMSDKEIEDVYEVEKIISYKGIRKISNILLSGKVIRRLHGRVLIALTQKNV